MGARPLIVALAALVAFATAAAPAHAAVTNLIPWSAEEDAPSDSFETDDGIMAYYTSTVRGAEGICIVPATVSDPGDNSLTCGLAEFGGVTPVIGIGSNWVPLAGPTLRAGHYRLLADGGVDGEEPDKLSIDFWVRECLDCDAAPAAGVFAAWKASAAEAAAGGEIACALYNTNKVTGKDLAKTVVREHLSPSPNVVVIASAFGGFAFGSLIDEAPQMAMLDKWLGVMNAVTCRAAAMFQAIVDDPPDPNYFTVAAPSLSESLSTVPDAQVNELQYTLDAMRAHGVAEIHAVERYQGAQIDANQQMMDTQAAAAARNGAALATGMRVAAIQLRGFADRLDAAGADESLTQADLDAARAFRQRMIDSGFTAEEQAQFDAAGVPFGEVATARADFQSRPLPDAAVGATLVSATRLLADRLEQEAPDQEAFAASMASSVARPQAATLKADIASRTGSNQMIPFAVRLSGEPSVPGTSEIVSYHWEFDDGTTDEGIQTTHVYETAGPHETKLTVTDSAGAKSTATQTTTGFPREALELPLCRDAEDQLVMRCPGFDALAPGSALTVAGTGPQTVNLKHVASLGAWDNSLVWFKVDDGQGFIDGHAPGTLPWHTAVLTRMRVAFGAGGLQPDSKITPFTVQIPADGGDHLAFAVVANNTFANFVASNPFNAVDGPVLLDHLFAAANPYLTVQALPYLRRSDGVVQIGFEDIPGDANNFVDEVIEVSGVKPETAGDLAVTVRADDPAAMAGEENGYQVNIRNAGAGEVILDSISLTLPEGFAHLPGTTRGATQSNPQIVGRALTWNGRFVVPSGGVAGLRFSVGVADSAGEYLAEATADARGIAITPSGPSARITVTAAPTPPSPPPLDPAPSPAPDPAPPVPTPTPAAPVTLLPRPVAPATLPSNRKCVSRRKFRIRLRESKADPLVSAHVFVNGKRVKAVRGKRLTVPVDLRGLPKGRFTIKVVGLTRAGRKTTSSRRYRTCAPKRR